MAFTFKQFLETDSSQLNELFGTFRNNKGADQQPRQSKAGADEKNKELEWKIAQSAAKNKRPLTPAEKNRIKDKMFADAKARHDDSDPISVRESEDEVLIDRPDYKLIARGKDFLIQCEIDGEMRTFTVSPDTHKFVDEDGQQVDRDTINKITHNHTEVHMDAINHIIERTLTDE